MATYISIVYRRANGWVFGKPGKIEDGGTWIAVLCPGKIVLGEDRVHTARIRTLLVLICLVPVGLYTKFYHGPFELWVHDYAGDIFYPMFWFFLIKLCWPSLSLWITGSLVFLCSTIIEFSQLLGVPLLSAIRTTFMGQTLIGTGFQWVDIIYYLLGTTAALALYQMLEKKPKYLEASRSAK